MRIVPSKPGGSWPVPLDRHNFRAGWREKHDGPKPLVFVANFPTDLFLKLALCPYGIRASDDSMSPSGGWRKLKIA
jgi:hypothetical protein